ncbi:MAG: hypothetical protein JRC86_11580 [Deltaproteobacteria bacterium]|nr:hypothetical protein [Deltaproteobacteria bacterium]
MAKLNENTRFAIFTAKNPKVIKSQKSDSPYFTLILHLAPANNSGYEVCPNSSAGCRAGCLYTAGRGGCTNVKTARIRRTVTFRESLQEFRSLVLADLYKLDRLCKENGKIGAVRMNGTSDIDWMVEWPELFGMFPSIQFYDYTKAPSRVGVALPSNYHLTFSRSEDNDDDVERIMSAGHANVAVVFDKVLPTSYNGYPVVSGENDDERFLDPTGHIIGLIAKGKARRDCSGFVVKSDIAVKV